jgi:hypothetical protein
VLVYLDAIIVHISSLRGRRWFQAAMLGCGFWRLYYKKCFMLRLACRLCVVACGVICL